MIASSRIRLRTKGDSDIIDITDRVAGAIAESGMKDGVAVVFVPGSTAAVTTTEFEPNLNADLKKAAERLAPGGLGYRHHETWGDDNGSSHIRASLIGPSISVPFAGGKPMLGTWQQIVLVDFDTRPRERELVVQLLGE